MRAVELGGRRPVSYAGIMQAPSAEALQMIGFILLAIALPLLAWAVLGDPSRRRLRCPRCWYRMEGIPKQEMGWVCPECGRKIAKERGLRRARRRWRWAALALLGIVVASQLWQQPARANERWQTRWIPTTALVLAPTRFSWLASVNEAVFVRYRNEQLPHWIAALIEWRDWRRAVGEMPSKLHTRATWPVGVEPVVWLRTADSLQSMFGGRSVAIELIEEPLRRRTTELLEPGATWLPAPGPAWESGLPLPAPTVTGQHRVRVRVSLIKRDERTSREYEIGYRAVAGIGEAITAEPLEPTASAVRAGTMLVYDSYHGDRFLFSTNGVSHEMHYQVVTDDGQASETACGVGLVSVNPNGVPFENGLAIRSDSPDPVGFARVHARLVVFQDPVLVLQRFPDATTYWPGRVEIPFSELLSR